MAEMGKKENARIGRELERVRIATILTPAEEVMAEPDWGAIETAYCAGVLSLRKIEAQYGISEGAVRKRAAKLGWVRNKKGGTQKRYAKSAKCKPAYQAKKSNPPN
ncbi:hypothetical protein [Pectobacterium carotovorum]